MANIGFRKAKCKDCHKCVRLCPVKAIRRKDEQAQFVADECILCGHCIEACPHHAIQVFSDIEKVKKYIQEGEKVVVSLSPAYLGAFDESEPGQFIEALYEMGFYEVRETAEGAVYVTNEYDRLLKEGSMDNIITTVCPVINNLVEKYYPELVSELAPIMTPVAAHAQMLREEFGDEVKIVSITPCLAEAPDVLKDERTKRCIDAVISFKELMRWMKEINIQVTECDTYHHQERMNPMVNGAYATGDGVIRALRAKSGERDGYKRIVVSGVDECKDILDCVLKGELHNCLLELNACVAGCVNGPVSGKKSKDRFKSLMLVQDRIMPDFPKYEDKSLDLSRHFESSAEPEEMPTEAQIREILAKIGKDTPDKELNCGACGFNTCREKAIASLRKRSDIYMCVNYMYDRLSSLTDVIMSVTPEMIIIVDGDLRIREFNNAAEVAFNISRDEAVKKYLYEIIDAEDFQEVFQNKRSIMNKKVVYKSYGLTTVQNIFYLRSQKVAIGFFRNTTDEEKEKENRRKLRIEGVNIAQAIIDKQMMVAQEIAGLLGETTAETKMTLMKLRDSMMSDEDL